MMRQLGLLPAGCQPWNLNMIAGTTSKFAYCSTMAVYIYETASPIQEYKLTAINAEHTKTITSIAWNPRCPNLIATFGADLKILIWDVTKQKVIAQLPNMRVVSCCIDWIVGQPDPQTISYIGIGGQLESWNITTGKVSVVKNITCAGGSKVTIFRWHHTKKNTISFGHQDGSISLFIQDRGSMKKRILRFSDDNEIEDPVVILSWDPLSNDYLLVANKVTGLRLIDTNSGSVISTFFLPSRAVSTCCFSWVSSAPGMFLTGDKETGVLRLWSVGQDQPLENFKVKSTGFNGIHVLNASWDSNIYDENLQTSSMQRKNSQSQVSSHSVPPAHVVCTFRDGGVGLYDLQKRKWKFLKDQGHIETIFDCRFKPDDPRMLATASFDGTIKIWSINDLTAVKTSVGNEGVIYSLSWAPENLNCIVCGTRRNGAFVWDFTKGKVLKRFTEHGYAAVFCVAWNQRDSHRIASCSEDSFCIVRRLDGKSVQKFPHPDSVYGCDWNIFDKNLLATGCEDGIARIWNVASDETSNCIIELIGHQKKVFNVRWHPLVKDILCTGSDDCTVRVWNIANNRDSLCIGILSGHTSKVRGLTWNFEIPHLLVSGSWDSTIRVWDIREGNQKCLEVVTDHGADVYGLTSHISAPFLVASTSRDSTVRLWTLAHSLSLVFAKVIAGHPLDDIQAPPSECLQNQSGLQLAGKMSKQIIGELKKKPRPAILKLRWFSELFSAIPALENLWDVACCSIGTKDSSLSAQYKNGILHTSHITKYKAADAQEIELSTAGHSPANRQQETALEKASNIHLKLGNLQRHCEILKSLGRWETALSLAPGVSISYWRNLAQEYAKVLKKSHDVASLSYQIAIGDSHECIQNLTAAGEYEDALLVVQSTLEGRVPSYKSIRKSLQNGDKRSEESYDSTEGNAVLKEMQSSCIEKLSQLKYLDGDSCRAASYLISNNDIAGAINCLVRANELLLALCVGQALSNHCTSIDLEEACVLFARKLEAEKHFFFAIEILKLSKHETFDTNQTWSHIHASCARYDGDEVHRNNLHSYAGLQSPDNYTQKGKQFETDEHFHESMCCYLLSSTPELGLKIGLELLCNELKTESWTLSNVFDMKLGAVFCISSKVLCRADGSHHKNMLLAISSYLGALDAIRSGYISMVVPLFEHAIAMTERVEMMPDKTFSNLFPFESQQLRQDLSVWKQHVSIKSQKLEKTLKEDMDSTVKKLFHRAGVDTITIDAANETIVAGSNLPSHSDVHVSSLTNRRIRGPVFWLEDDKTVISLNEAIMWARVNQFSPTGSGSRIVPF